MCLNILYYVYEKNLKYGFMLEFKKYIGLEFVVLEFLLFNLKNKF